MNHEHLQRLAQQSEVPDPWRVVQLHTQTNPKGPQRMDQATNLNIMKEICEADKLDAIIWLPNTVALIRQAREERDRWRARALDAEAKLAAVMPTRDILDPY